MLFAFALSRGGWSNRFASFQIQSRLFATEFSQRGKDAVSLLPTYLADARAVQKYSPTTPQGALQLSVAENQMLEDLLVPVLSDLGSSEFTADCIYYQPTQGRESLRVAMASFLQRLLGLPNKKLEANNLVVGAGCNAVLENLCFCLTQPGDAVLIPTPYYAAFEFDLVARAGLSIVPVNPVQHYTRSFSGSIPAEAYYPSRVALESAYQQAYERGHPPRVLLLSHPQNPLGICYPASVVMDCIEWCRSREVHLINDEIYAGSVYKSSKNNNQQTDDDKAVPFTSSLVLCSGSNYQQSSTNTGNDESHLGLGPFVHFIYALSKDFGLSGLRVGACYTENHDILLPLQKLNDLCQISSQTQVLVEAMLTKQDEKGNYWTDVFLRENQRRIRHRCDTLEVVLTECNIPFLKASAGLFLWIDLSEFLPPDGTAEERERTLYLELIQKFGLLLTPGLSMRHPRPGYFRCVFTAAGNEEFALSLDRFRNFVQQKRSSI